MTMTVIVILKGLSTSLTGAYMPVMLLCTESKNETGVGGTVHDTKI